MADIKQTSNEPAKVKVVKTLPSLANAEEGELYYDVANTRLALRLTTGWVTFDQD